MTEVKRHAFTTNEEWKVIKERPLDYAILTRTLTN